MSQDYISTIFDGLFFILIGLIILVSSVMDSYAVYQSSGLITAILDFLPGLGWSLGVVLFGYALYCLSLNAKQPLVFDKYS